MKDIFSNVTEMGGSKTRGSRALGSNDKSDNELRLLFLYF